jgi:4-amino-4-deoxy-L-arabinose transferase-like glycosyltransferase
MRNKIYNILLLLVFFLGIALRIPEIINRNYLFGFDQGWNYNLVKEIVVDHKFRLIGAETSLGVGFNGVFHGPGYYYLLAIFYILFKGDPYGGLVLMFLSGLITLIITYILGLKIFGKIGALILLFLVSNSPPIISQSRFLWTPHPASVLIIILFGLIYLSTFNPIKFLPLAMLVAAMVYHFHLGIAIPLIISVFIYSFIFVNNRWQILFRNIFAIIIAFIPGILFEIRHNFMAINGIIQYLNELFQPHSSSRIYKFTEHLLNYWTNAVGTFPFPLILSKFIPELLFFIFIIFGVVYCFKTKIEKPQKGLLIYLITLLFTTWIFFMSLNNNIWDYYLIPLHFVYCFLTVYICLNLIKNNSISRNISYLIFGLIVLIFGLGAFQQLYKTYTSDYKDYGGVEKILGKKAALDAIFKDANSKPFTIMIFTPPVYTYPYDYLFFWYGNRKYGFIPKTGKSQLTYLLIQPDWEKPWSYQGWLDTVVKDGKILSTDKLPSGFIIQKRSFYE